MEPATDAKCIIEAVIDCVDELGEVCYGSFYRHCYITENIELVVADEETHDSGLSVFLCGASVFETDGSYIPTIFEDGDWISELLNKQLELLS